MSSYQDKLRLGNSEVSEIDNSKKANKPKAKVKVLKNHGFNIPKRNGPYSVRGCIYIYNMIKEANGELVERDDVCEAYNSFVECCLKYGDNIHSHIPTKYATYHHKLRPFLGYEESTKTYCLPIGLRYPKSSNPIINEENNKKKEDSEKDILDKYTVLYELIKRDMIPYMEQKSWEINCKIETDHCNTRIYEHNTSIRQLEEHIVKHQKSIAELAQRALNAQKPPVLTSFD